MDIQPGLVAEFDFEVTDEFSTDVGGTVRRKVLSTPRMIGLMERASMLALHPRLSPGTTSVGFEISIKHVAAAAVGTTCTVRSELVEVNEGRKFRFAVEVDQAGRTIGVGAHERRLIEAEKFAPSVT